jgi:hypothetical protein
MTASPNLAEEARLAEAREQDVPWWAWGPYLSERQWGTVREDYSEHGTAWEYFSHDQARSRAYHWGEEGIAGISDDEQRLCFALALWNGKDPILKERIFGLTNAEGNHGEDVKEYYFYLDCTPTHSYMKYLYKYPHNAYPYDGLVGINRRRCRDELEYEQEQLEILAARGLPAPERPDPCLLAKSLSTAASSRVWKARYQAAYHGYSHLSGMEITWRLTMWNHSPSGPFPTSTRRWATIFLYRTEQSRAGRGDLDQLSKLTFNFTCWVNRKDRFGHNVFEGGFLGLDNIGVFDRSAPLPTGGYLEQADGTSWMALFCQNMLEISLELAAHDPAYEDMALKFAEHFLWIAAAMNRGGEDGMWDEEDGFYYDLLRLPDGRTTRLKVRSMESTSGLFGGNSNWRGPIWFPVNLLIIRALLQYYLYYGDNLKVECPTGSGNMMNLFLVAQEISNRLISIFRRDAAGRRPVFGHAGPFQSDPHWRDHLLFYEYFHGDNSAGVGASHQTGWTGLAGFLIKLFGELDPKAVLEVGKEAAFVGSQARTGVQVA